MNSSSEWQRVRAEFAERASQQGLLDVVVEQHETPFGLVSLGATERGIVQVGFATDDQQQMLEELAERVSPRLLRASNRSTTLARRQLDEYFDGRRRQFDVDLDWRLTRGFRREVLDATARIPYGGTSTYRELATQVGNAKAVRAAGTALATNPLAIFVPCHRVLRTDGGLGGYRGGTGMKFKLLELESQASDGP